MADAIEVKNAKERAAAFSFEDDMDLVGVTDDEMEMVMDTVSPDPVVIPPVTETPPEEIVDDQPAPVVVVPEVVTPPVVDTPPVEPAFDPLVALRDTVTQQAEMIAKLLAEKGVQQPIQPVVTTTQVQETQLAAKEAAIIPTVEDVIQTLMVDDDQFDKLLTSPEAFNAHIAKVLKTFAEVIKPAVVEQVYRSIPAMVTQQIDVQQTLQSAVDQFYTEHEVLKSYKKLVGANIMHIGAEHPDWTIQQVMPEAAKRTYSSLGLLPAGAQPVIPGNPTPPAPVGKKPALPGRQAPRAAQGAGIPQIPQALRDELDALV